jgi:Mg2+-importing ATPase
MLTLLTAAGVAAIVGEAVNASIIVVMVFLGVSLNFVQSYRAHRAADRLRQSVTPTATVLRNGVFGELPRREIVTGDVIRLAAGDLVPADARLLTSRELHVQQAALTGESLPAEKDASDPSASEDEHGPRSRRLVFFGTSVVSGVATALVTATGGRTMLGDVAARLAARPPETAFDRGIREFGALITRTVIFLVLFLVLAAVALRREPLTSLLFAVALAVGLVPEFLPMITSVTLANGAVKMARAKVIVKHLAAIENFGNIDVLCSDKTGTLTHGEMQVASAVDSNDGASTRVLRLAHANARLEAGIRSPFDHAIVVAAAATLDAPSSMEHCEKLDEIPFDFERRRLSVVVQDNEQRLLITKGAPEALLECCTTYDDESGARQLDQDTRARCAALLHRWGALGLRVLAVAWRQVPPQSAYSAADETELVLAGFITFADPPLEDARRTIAALRQDGVEVKLLTGDDALVARAVCAQTGLDAAHALTGDDVDALSDAALAHAADVTTVFARVTPSQKNRIILALRARGHVIGYLGDGINDAPSLHTADVGISVASAVDVAKDAADIILLERDLGVLHTGILEGRKAFGNIMKYLLMGTSSAFGNMFSMAAAFLFLPFLPMQPTQILVNNFLYDFAQVAIPTDRVDDEYVRTPQHWRVAGIRRFMLSVGPISSLFDFLTFAVLIYVFHASPRLFQSGWFVESLATQTLVLLVIRTAGSPLRSRPSAALAATVAVAVLTGLVLPYSPLAAALDFVPLPASYLGFVLLATVAYLLIVQLAKRRVLPTLVRRG